MNTFTALPAQRAHDPANGDSRVRVGDRERDKVITRLGRQHDRRVQSASGHWNFGDSQALLRQKWNFRPGVSVTARIADLPESRWARPHLRSSSHPPLPISSRPKQFLIFMAGAPLRAILNEKAPRRMRNYNTRNSHFRVQLWTSGGHLKWELDIRKGNRQQL
jgi:hypothetical protein